MPDFIFTSPQGQKYKVSGPEGATEQQAFQMLQRQIAGMPPVDVTADVAKSAAIGPVKGAISMAGTPGDIRSLASRGVSYLGEKLGASPESVDRFKSGASFAAGMVPAAGPLLRHGPTSEQVRSGVEGVTGELYEPQTREGRYAQAATSALPAAVAGPGGLARGVAAGVASGLAGEAAGQATEGTKYEPYARLAASFLAGFPFGQWRAKPGAAPLAEELKDAADAQYKAIRTMDLRLKPQPIATVADGIAAKLGDRGFSATNVPETFAVVDRLRGLKKSPTGSFVGAQDFDNARQELLQATRNATNRREAVAAWEAIGDLDKYLSKIPAGDVIRGDGVAASKLFDQARGNWAAMKRLEMAGGKVELGELNADTAHSGTNRDNAIRQAVKQLIRPNKYGKTLAEQHGFSDREIKAMREIARGTAATNTLRYFGNLLGGGGGIGQAALTLGGIGLGYETGHPELAALGVLGYGLRRGAGAMTERQARKLLEQVGRRSPAGQAAGATVTPGQPIQSAAASALRAAAQRPSDQSYGGPQ